MKYKALFIIGLLSLSIVGCGDTSNNTIIKNNTEQEFSTEISLGANTESVSELTLSTESETNVQPFLSEEDKVFNATFEMINNFGFTELENGADKATHSYSNLSFTIQPKKCVKTDDYYEYDVVLNKEVVIPSDVKVGDQIYIVTDELNDKTETLTVLENGLLVNEETNQEYYYFDNGSEMVTLYCDSDDRVDAPFYEGKLRIKKDAKAIIELAPEIDIDITKLHKGDYSWWNAVSFDENGYATSLVFVGD